MLYHTSFCLSAHYEIFNPDLRISFLSKSRFLELLCRKFLQKLPVHSHFYMPFSKSVNQYAMRINFFPNNIVNLFLTNYSVFDSFKWPAHFLVISFGHYYCHRFSQCIHLFAFPSFLLSALLLINLEIYCLPIRSAFFLIAYPQFFAFYILDCIFFIEMLLLQSSFHRKFNTIYLTIVLLISLQYMLSIIFYSKLFSDVKTARKIQGQSVTISTWAWIILDCSEMYGSEK